MFIQVEFLQQKSKESSAKSSKQISDLKSENKTKEREATKNANDLKRATEKVSALEEKIAALKVDFKQKDAEREEEFAKKLNLKEEKLKELRLNLQNKEDELTNTKGQLKEAKETIQVNTYQIS